MFPASLFGNLANDFEVNIPASGDTFIEEILEKYVDATFGKYKVSYNGYYFEISLEITVKNNVPIT